MNPMLPKPVIAGNWKMNMTPAETLAFFAEWIELWQPRADRTLIFFPPALSFAAAAHALRHRDDVRLGVQNVHWEKGGAFTGENSIDMAVDAGARFILAGHSERRQLFGESDEAVGQKTAAALNAGLSAIACVGETLEQREAGQLRDVLLRQLDAILDALPVGATDRLLLAYEPVWAIGTGVNATPADAAEAHAVLRLRCTERLGQADAAAIPILYGGSVKPDNAAELLAADGVDGLLVGGASLKVDSFARIAAAG